MRSEASISTRARVTRNANKVALPWPTKAEDGAMPSNGTSVWKSSLVYTLPRSSQSARPRLRREARSDLVRLDEDFEAVVVGTSIVGERWSPRGSRSKLHLFEAVECLAAWDTRSPWRPGLLAVRSQEGGNDETDACDPRWRAAGSWYGCRERQAFC
jgi:hypothetical protein